MSSAVIFSGTKVKAQKDTISINSGPDIISSTTDPTAVAYSASAGSLLLNTSSGKLYRKNDAGSTTNWTEVGASGQSGINYIANPDALTSTSGWSTYKESDSVTFQDAGDTVTLNSHGLSNNNEIAFTSITSTTGISTNTRYYVVSATTNTFQVATSVGGSALALTTNGSGTMVRFTPKVGSGGTADLSWSRSTTTPLRGNADFNLVKTAVNSMGQGVAYDFSIDLADLGKVLTVAFNYELISGTYAAGDVSVYLVQDPSGTPIVLQPNGYQVASATIGTKMQEIATFQTSNSVTSYRLCIHVSTVSASAYTLGLDSISVGPSATLPASQVISFSGTQVSQSVTANVTNISFTSTLDRTGSWNGTQFACPISGDYLVQTSAVLSSSGTVSVYKNGSFVNYASTTVPSAGAACSGSLLLPNCTTGDLISLRSTVTQTVSGGSLGIFCLGGTPIQGTGTVAVALSGSTTSIGTNTVVTPTTIVRDSHGSWSGSTYTVPVSGYYNIQATIQAGGNTATAYEIYYKQNAGSSVLLGGNRAPSATANMYASGSAVIYCNAGDTLQFIGNQTGVAQAPLVFAASLFRLSSSALSTANETVSFDYYNLSGQSIPTGSFTTITNWTKVHDTQNIFNSTTGIATIPTSGTYLLTGLITYNAGQTWAIGQSYDISLLVNGSTNIYTKTMTIAVTNQNWVTSNASMHYRFRAGDTVALQTYQASSGSRSIFNNVETFRVRFTLAKVGN